MKRTARIVVTVTVTIVHLTKIDTFVWPARRCGHWQPLRSTIEGEEQRVEERRTWGAVMRGRGHMAVLLCRWRASGTHIMKASASLMRCLFEE
jgi:hypothetical protein